MMGRSCLFAPILTGGVLRNVFYHGMFRVHHSGTQAIRRYALVVCSVEDTDSLHLW